MSRFIQYSNMPYMREPLHHINSIHSDCSASTISSINLDSGANHKTETLKWFFKAVSAVDNSYKATTENLNKLVSFYL